MFNIFFISKKNFSFIAKDLIIGVKIGVRLVLIVKCFMRRRENCSLSGLLDRERENECRSFQPPQPGAVERIRKSSLVAYANGISRVTLRIWQKA